MLILSQDKKTIVNMDNVDNLGFRSSVDRTIAYIAADTEKYHITLAKYTAEDRAKGIIQDIIRRADVGARTFIMPEE